MQALSVELTLPHERAVVTNTCSNRNEGFSYGCLLTGVRGLSVDDSFIAIRGNPACLFSLPYLYCNVGCDTCTAQPPVPVPPQAWSLKVLKYI